jgi:hypothetical protein
MKEDTKKDYSIYKIKKGDTLASVAAYFEKTQQEIKGYHNLFCIYELYIHNDFPEDLKELYVYPQLHHKAVGLDKHLSENNYLQQKKWLAIQNYTLQYHMIEGELTTTIDFEISVEHKGQSKEGHVYEINKIAPTTINGQLPPNDTEEVKEKILDTVYPIQVLVHDNGSWQKVLYDKKITKRLTQTKKEILEYYQGETVHQLLDHAQKVFAQEESFCAMFAHNWMLDAIFSNIYRYYNHLSPIEEKITFALLNKAKPVTYSIVQKIEDFTAESKTMTISKEGTLSDTRTRTDFEMEIQDPHYDNKGTREVKGNFEQKITLNMQTPRSVEIKVRKFEKS